MRWDKQVRRLSTLVDNLLDVSRISAGRPRPETRGQVDLVEVAREIVGRLWGEVANAETPATVLAEAGPVVGLWDPLRVEQVVSNLLANALKYGGGKPVTVTVSRNERFACFEVRDHGIGIPPDKQARIFERFERAVSSRVYGGLGLGLYIARQIVDAHGGMLEVSSNPGSGSIFTMRLPIGTATASLLSPQPSQPQGAEPLGADHDVRHRRRPVDHGRRRSAVQAADREERDAAREVGLAERPGARRRQRHRCPVRVLQAQQDAVDRTVHALRAIAVAARRRRAVLGPADVVVLGQRRGRGSGDPPD